MTKEVSRGQVAAAYQEIAQTEAGQIILADLMRRFSFTRHSTYRPGDDQLTLAHREGQRSVLIHVGFMLEVDPKQLDEDDHASEF